MNITMSKKEAILIRTVLIFANPCANFDTAQKKIILRVIQQINRKVGPKFYALGDVGYFK